MQQQPKRLITEQLFVWMCGGEGRWGEAVVVTWSDELAVKGRHRAAGQGQPRHTWSCEADRQLARYYKPHRRGFRCSGSTPVAAWQQYCSPHLLRSVVRCRCRATAVCRRPDLWCVHTSPNETVCVQNVPCKLPALDGFAAGRRGVAAGVVQQWEAAVPVSVVPRLAEHGTR